MTPTLTFDDVSKWYGDTVAVASLSFSLSPGVTGLLGHNGAGKSTALKLCAGFATPTTVRNGPSGPRTLTCFPIGSAPIWSGTSR